MNPLSRYFVIVTFALTAIFFNISKGTDAKRLKRYFGGRDAEPGEHNWTVSISFKNHRRDHVCAGSIIDARYVLTVAHCVEFISPAQIIVRGGIIDLKDASAILSNVSRIITYPAYVPMIGDAPSQNDIAIIQLQQNLVLGGRISAIPLPKSRTQVAIATLASWGALQPKRMVESRMLQIATMEVISDGECLAKGRPARRPQFICVHHPNGIVLKGDSGSPLTYKGELIGIAATSMTTMGMPSSFTNVHYYLKWINEIVGFENNV